MDYDFDVREAYRFAEEHGLTSDVERIRSVPIHRSATKPSAVRKAHMLLLLEERGLIDEFSSLHWPGRQTARGTATREGLLRRLAQNQAALAGNPTAAVELAAEQAEEEAEDVANANIAFRLEAQLRDVLAGNLQQLRIGEARLSLFRDSNGRAGVEYPTAVGPIDILATAEDGSFYVFELKLGRGPDRAIGQLQRYMGWVTINLAGGQPAKGVLVASAIDEKARYAAYPVSDITLLEYALDFKVVRVERIGPPPGN